MKLSSFTIIVTDDCNFDCKYCPQTKEKKFIDLETIKKAVDFFFPALIKGSSIGFYGGEPLLCFDTIKESVSYIEKKNFLEKEVSLSITTNGSLLNKEILEFLNRHRFSVKLSFDGLAHNISRRKENFEKIVSKIKKIQKYSQIELEINSVFTPGTIGYLAESIKFILELGVKDMRYVLSTIEEWEKKDLRKFENELLKTVDIVVSSCKKSGSIIVSNFKIDPSKKGIFVCTAGKDRMAVTPEGKIWGCYQFHDYFKGKEKIKEYSKYSFADLGYFIEHFKTLYPEILPNYTELRMDNFSSGDSYCFLCGDIESCDVCPVYTAYSTSVIGKIPGWVCEINKIKSRGKKIFQKKIQKIKKKG